MLHFTQHFSYFCLRNLELQHIFSLADGKFSAPAAVYGPASANFSYGHTAVGGGCTRRWKLTAGTYKETTSVNVVPTWSGLRRADELA